MRLREKKASSLRKLEVSVDQLVRLIGFDILDKMIRILLKSKRVPLDLGGRKAMKLMTASRRPHKLIVLKQHIKQLIDSLIELILVFNFKKTP